MNFQTWPPHNIIILYYTTASSLIISYTFKSGTMAVPFFPLKRSAICVSHRNVYTNLPSVKNENNTQTLTHAQGILLDIYYNIIIINSSVMRACAYCAVLLRRRPSVLAPRKRELQECVVFSIRRGDIVFIGRDEEQRITRRYYL